LLEVFVIRKLLTDYVGLLSIGLLILIVVLNILLGHSTYSVLWGLSATALLLLKRKELLKNKFYPIAALVIYIGAFVMLIQKF
jgi:hypothetical protein